MKRMTVLLALLLAGMLTITGVLPWGLPEPEQLVAGPTRWDNGDTLVAENRTATSRLYTLREDNVVGLYEEPRIQGGRESRIARALATGEGACFVRVLDGGADWQLVQLDPAGKAQVLHADTFEDPVTVTGLRAQGASYWITGVGENRAIFVYEYNESEGVKLRMILPAWWLRWTVSAEYDGRSDRIRATTELGDHCFVTPDGERTYSDDAAEAPLPTLRPQGGGWLLCKRTPLLAAALLWLLAAAVVTAAVVLSRRSRLLADRLTAVSGAAALLVLLTAAAGVFGTVCAASGLLAAWNAGRWALTAALLLWLLLMLLMRMTAGQITCPVAAMTRQMDRISDGDLTARESASGKDELCRMDQSLQLMCMNLSVLNYESASTVRAYRRFVPEKMAQLLERPVAEEIQLGDTRRMTGNVGLFSIGNRAEARNSLEDADFVRFVNHSYGIFHDCIAGNRGWMLSGALSLSDMEALFPNAAADGVRAGLDFLGRLRVGEEEKIPAPRACLILHKASFLYGVAGQEERLFPYLSSAELEFLGSYAPRFDQAGVRIAATEAYWKQLADAGFAGRYIGFVSAGERGGAYKLYEILDAYPELERDLRRGYDARFQEAINLFYHNDFYLARNLFSTLLRACPGDGVARWYLFACERFFNQESGEEPDYSLFGVEE